MKRYDMEYGAYGSAEMMEWENGEYYLRTDVDALLAQCEEALEGANQTIESEFSERDEAVEAALAAIRAAREGT